MVPQKKHAQSRMPHLFKRMPQNISEMQHVFSEDMLQLRCETREKRSVWLANYAVVLPDVSHGDTRAYDGCKEQTNVEGIADVRRGTSSSNR